MPDGAQVVGQDGDVVRMQVSIPLDEHGFFGRECPACAQVYRVDNGHYNALPDDLELWCVYCGHHAEHSEFMTRQQKDRMMRAVGDLGAQIAGQAIDQAFRRFSRPRRRSRSGFGIEIRFRSKPFYPRPLPGISEEQLIRIRECGSCGLKYAVFGEHRYCPVSGPLPADVVALDALAAETARLDGLVHLPTETVAVLREQGVFTRIWVDTLENLVGVVETLAAAVFRAAIVDAEQRVKGKGNVFQRLDDSADLFVAAGFADLRPILGAPAWARLREVWAIRHLFTHNDGVVDAKFLAKVPTSSARPGQRLTINESLSRQAISDTETLCKAIAALTTP